MKYPGTDTNNRRIDFRQLCFLTAAVVSIAGADGAAEEATATQETVSDSLVDSSDLAVIEIQIRGGESVSVVGSTSWHGSRRSRSTT